MVINDEKHFDGSGAIKASDEFYFRKCNKYTKVKAELGPKDQSSDPAALFSRGVLGMLGDLCQGAQELAPEPSSALATGPWL